MVAAYWLSSYRMAQGRTWDAVQKASLANTRLAAWLIQSSESDRLRDWGLDFVQDAVERGRAIRVLSVVDAYTRARGSARGWRRESFFLTPQLIPASCSPLLTTFPTPVAGWPCRF